MGAARPAAENQDADGGDQQHAYPQGKIRAIAGIGDAAVDIAGRKIVRPNHQIGTAVDLYDFRIILGTDHLGLQLSRLHALGDLHIQLNKPALFQIDLSRIRISPFTPSGTTVFLCVFIDDAICAMTHEREITA